MIGFQQGLLLWDKSQKQSQYWLHNEFRYSLLDTLFAQAILSDNQYKKGSYSSYFHGTKDNIKFISTAPIMDIHGRVHTIEMRVDRGKEHKHWKLFYREGTRYSDIDRGFNWNKEWVKLLGGLKQISFSYLAPANPIPQELDSRWLTNDEKRGYRDVATWVSHYNTQTQWLYPVQIAINFTDKRDVLHQWLFTPPSQADAWSIKTYDDD